MQNIIDFFHRCYDSVSDFVEKLISLAQWIPVLWRDRDWDFNFLLQIMKYKVERMRDHHLKWKITSDYQEISDQMNECAEIIDKLSYSDNHKYVQKEMEEFCEKWGDVEWDEIKGTDENGTSHIYIDIYYSKARELGKEDEADEELRKLGDLNQQREAKDYDRLFELLLIGSKRWWD